MLDEREAFEAWLWSQDWVRDHHFYRRDMKGSTRFGQYVSAEVEFAWEAWQERGRVTCRTNGAALPHPNLPADHKSAPIQKRDKPKRADGVASPLHQSKHEGAADA